MPKLDRDWCAAAAWHVAAVLSEVGANEIERFVKRITVHGKVMRGGRRIVGAHGQWNASGREIRHQASLLVAGRCSGRPLASRNPHQSKGTELPARFAKFA